MSFYPELVFKGSIQGLTPNTCRCLEAFVSEKHATAFEKSTVKFIAPVCARSGGGGGSIPVSEPLLMGFYINISEAYLTVNK